MIEILKCKSRIKSIEKGNHCCLLLIIIYFQSLTFILRVSASNEQWSSIQLEHIGEIV